MIILVGKRTPSTIDHGSRFNSLDSPTAKAHVIPQPFAATPLIVLVDEPAGQRSVQLSPTIHPRCFDHVFSAFRVPQLEMVFLPEAALLPSYSIPQCFQEAQLPFPEPFIKNGGAKLLQHATSGPLYRWARVSELAWSKHFCLLLMPSSIVSFSPSSQDG